MTRRAIALVASVACGAVLGLFLDDVPIERIAIEPMAPGEVRAPVVVPAPALPVTPVTPVPVAPRPAVQDTRPPRATAHADGSRRERMDARRRARPARLRTPAPVRSEPPPWGTP